MGSSTLPSVCPLLVMICPLPLCAVTIWSLWTIFSSIVHWLLVFSHGFNCYYFMPLLWPLLLCVAMRFLASRRMSSVLFLFSLSTLSMLVNSTFGWLAMIIVFGMPLLVRSTYQMSYPFSLASVLSPFPLPSATSLLCPSVGCSWHYCFHLGWESFCPLLRSCSCAGRLCWLQWLLLFFERVCLSPFWSPLLVVLVGDLV